MPNDIIISVVGARPHLTKVYPFVKAMANRKTKHFIVHTGQHYSNEMSNIFFDQFSMPIPNINLNVGSGTHAEQTANVMIGVEKIVLDLKPIGVVVYGDTNSTLGATLAAAKHYYPVVHIEAGVRCDKKHMPEEINRKVIDHSSDYLICPSELAVQNLKREGLIKGVMNLGDFMYDTFLTVKTVAQKKETILPALGLEQNNYYLSTIHREASTNNASVLVALIETLGDLDKPVILPMHPRTQNCLKEVGFNLEKTGNLKIIDPVGHLEIIQFLLNANKVITDSGGLQKEAYWAGVPCITMMDETTWPETLEAGWNVLVGLDTQKIRLSAASPLPEGTRPEVYGAPGAALRLVNAMGW
ncbi:UDP-N-acetylglucosamine 2-epimerase (non-hydrolyzing) [bacterium]|nr:UDP-N-acetylglucosamine 2-epimerase (non-hydrolyzing) [bacterium]